MRKISVIDVTLRDGGCVNNFDFGSHVMSSILFGLEKSGVDYIELGYIDEHDGSARGTTKFSDERVIAENFLTQKRANTKYVAMFDYGKFNPENLRARTDSDIDGLRLAFHKKDYKDVANIGRKIIEKGYEFFVQPMLTLRYSDSELLDLIDVVNKELPDASGFYFVDSFGEMRHNDVIRILSLVDHNLMTDMPLGFHSHNNLQMSYANAISVLQFNSARDLFIDSSVMGMGKGAGNLNTELLLEHLNLNFGKAYDIMPLLNIMDTSLNRIRSEFYWGYSAEYYLSAINECSPSYARHFMNKHMLPITQIAELLSLVVKEKRNSFDRVYADTLYNEYILRSFDDAESILNLRAALEGKTVLLLAPGRTLYTAKQKINSYIKEQEPIVISVSILPEPYNPDYIFIANQKRYAALQEYIAIAKNEIRTPIICSSNILVKNHNNTCTINYADYINPEDGMSINSGVMIINLLIKLGVREIVLAGYDGYGIRSYAPHAELDCLSPAEIDLLNASIDAHIKIASKNTKVTFLTDSLYNKPIN